VLFPVFIEKVTKFDYTDVLIMISHTGTIKSINNQHLIVKIISETACSSCHAKGACSSAEQSEKEIEIRHSEDDFSVGEQVLVVTSNSQGYRALIYAYVLPLILLVVSLIIFVPIFNNEAKAAMASILCLLPYYLLLWLLRSKIRDSFHFNVQKFTNLPVNE
jgi:sigma-E factor negative regulatory protein RseC